MPFANASGDDRSMREMQQNRGAVKIVSLHVQNVSIFGFLTPRLYEDRGLY
jgi:hypothetical protein